MEAALENRAKIKLKFNFNTVIVSRAMSNSIIVTELFSFNSLVTMFRP